MLELIQSFAGMIVKLWPLWLCLAGAVVGFVSGWAASTRAIVADVRDGQAIYLHGSHYQLIPVDREDEIETQYRREYGTMAEQGW